MRLNKYLSACGISSRRKSDEFILQKRVKVNGVVAELGQEVSDSDVVMLDDRVLEKISKKYYFILNKPKGCVTTMHDDRERTTVLDIFHKAFVAYAGADAEEPKVFSVGRLDYNTQGLLIMTNDGDFANKLMHPRSHIEKVYNAVVYPHLSKEDLISLQNGVVVDGVKTLPAKLKILKRNDKTDMVEVKITQGMNRQIRKMFDCVNKRVDDLSRVAIGGVKLGDLKRGEIRELTQEEIDILRKN